MGDDGRREPSNRSKPQLDRDKAYAMMRQTPPDLEGLRKMLDDPLLDKPLAEEIRNFLNPPKEATDGRNETSKSSKPELDRAKAYAMMLKNPPDFAGLRLMLQDPLLDKPLADEIRRFLEANDKPPSNVTPPEDDKPLTLSNLGETFTPGSGGDIGFGVMGPSKSRNTPSRFFPYFVKDDEVARYADGVNQVANLRKIRK